MHQVLDDVDSEDEPEGETADDTKLKAAAAAVGIKLVARGTMGWVPNGDRKGCSSCKKVFTVRVRRHHCRFCGEVVCNSCSRNRVKIPGQVKPVRTCDTCVQQKKGKKEIKEVKKK
jgi:hypothetical protein